MDSQNGGQTSVDPPDGYVEPINALLKKVLQQGGFALSFTVHHLSPDTAEEDAPEYVIEFKGADADLLLERNGALLDALEHVILKAVRLREEYLRKFAFDCHEWRRLRIEELRLTAQVAAERVLENGDPFALGPMSPRERRIIHLALRDRPNLRTVSEGVGAERHIVIMPNR